MHRFFIFFRLIFFVTSFVIFAGIGLPECHSLVKIMDKYGYTVLYPPNKVYAPGTILYFDRDNDKDRGIACFAEETLGAEWEKLLQIEDSMQMREDLSNNAHAELSAYFLDEISADIKFQNIQSYKVEFTNPKVLFVSAATVQSRMDKRSEGCKQVVRELSDKKEGGERKYDLFLINSAIQGDLEYTFEFSNEANLSVESKIKLLEGIKGKINLGDVVNGTDSIVGKNIYWGAVMNKIGVQFKDLLSTVKEPVKTASSKTRIKRKEDAGIKKYLNYSVLNTLELKKRQPSK